MRALVVVLALTGCGRVGFARLGDNGTSGWWDPAWTQRVKLVIDNAASPEGLIDFPLLVRLDTTRIDPTAARPDGGDLRFVDGDGQTVLDHDLETWDFPGTGQAVAWVRVPRIAAGASDGVVWMYYGNPAATARPATPTWSAAYRAVYHLGADLRDATANANDGGGARPPTPSRGRIGTGRGFFEADHDAIEIPDAASLHPDAALTVSGWMSIRTSGTAWRCLISRATTFSDDSNDLWLGVYLDKTYTEVWTEASAKTSKDGPAVPHDVWQHLAAVWTGTRVITYVNGVDTGRPIPVTKLLASPMPLVIGADIGAGATAPNIDWVEGEIDEVRVEGVARSAGWMAAQYRSMIDKMVTFVAE